MDDQFGFKFKISEFVQCVVASRTGVQTLMPDASFVPSKPAPGIVIERRLVQCYAGVQRYYGVRFLGQNGAPLLDLSEIELEPWERPQVGVS